MTRSIRIGSVLFACVLGFTPLARAQVDATSAVLTGTVTDATGSVRPGATVAVASVERGTTRTTITDRVGVYRQPILEPGSYDLRIEQAGFAPRVFGDIQLTVGQIAVYDVQLSLGTVASSVEVTVPAQVSEPRRTQ